MRLVTGHSQHTKRQLLHEGMFTRLSAAKFLARDEALPLR
jgi:hypothetical protein